MAEYSESAPEDQNEKKRVEAKIKKFDRMSSARSQTENHWQECMKYIVPRKEDVTSTRQPGDKRGNELFDTTAIHSNQLLAAALHGMLTNPTTQFFELIMGDPSLDDNEAVKAWLQDTGQKMFTVIQNSNFQTEVHEIYIDEGAIGTACVFMGEHDETVIHFNARHMKEIYVEENNLGLIDTVYRKFMWKPRNIIQEFGIDHVPLYVRKKYEEGCDDEWPVLHCVEPKIDYERGTIHAFDSEYILKDECLSISKGGFREFPYAVPRWTKTSGEVYGRGPGMEMLPDIKMLNSMMETIIKGAQKTVDPPLMVSDDAVIGRVRLTPGGLTAVRPSSDVPIRPLITDARIDFGQQMVEGIRLQVRKGFFVDQLQLQQGPQMTATEVSQRVEESLRLMGPVLGRQHFEFLRPVIERLFGVMDRRGMFLDAPPEIQGKKFDVRYSSQVARAQKISEGNTFMRAIQIAAPIVQADPKVLDNLDGDHALKYIFDLYDVPVKLLRPEREVSKLRDQRAQLQQQALQQQNEMHQAEVASKTLPGMAQMGQVEASKAASSTQ